jgi:Ca2+-binding RTX toxin-like protein
LVIDASGLPKGTVLELQDVDFAVIRGDGIVVRGGAGENVVYGDAGSQNIVLTGSNDMIHGGGGDDTVGSTGSDSTLFGGAGNDQMMPGSGKNLLHGGDGEDFAVFAGALADYEVVRDNGITRVRSLATPGDEHMLVNVEAIQFGDQRLVVENDAPLGWIATLYEQVLGRQAELDGYQFWAASYDDGTPIGDICMPAVQTAQHKPRQSELFLRVP